MKKNNILKIGLVILVTFAISGICYSPSADTTPEIPQYWAILFNPFDDGSATWQEASLWLNETLQNYGWNEDNIISLFDEDGTYSKLQSKITNWLDLREDSKDTTLIWIGTHGWSDQDGGYFCGYDYKIYYDDLDEWLDELESNGIAIIVDCCKSWYANDNPYFDSPLKKDGRIVVTSVDYTDDDSGKGFFSNLMVLGLNEVGDYYNAGDSTPTEDKNGVTSIREAYNYCIYDDYNRIPTFKSWYITENDRDELHITFHDWTDGRIDQKTEETWTTTLYSVNHWVIGTNEYECKLSQSFRPEFNYLTKLRFFMKKTGLPSKDIWVSIHYPDEEGGPGNMIVGAETCVSPEEINRDKRLISFIFDNPIQLTPGNTYYIVLQVKELDYLGSGYSIRNTPNDRYDSGCLWWIDEQIHVDWEQESDEDLCFITYGKNPNENVKPYVPQRPSGPHATFQGLVEKYYFLTEDVNGDNIHYQVDWGDNTYPVWLGPFETYPFAYHSWENSGFYHIKVRAIDDPNGDGDITDGIPTHFSDVFTVWVSGM